MQVSNPESYLVKRRVKLWIHSKQLTSNNTTIHSIQHTGAWVICI